MARRERSTEITAIKLHPVLTAVQVSLVGAVFANVNCATVRTLRFMEEQNRKSIVGGAIHIVGSVFVNTPN
jgi:hypothetical protein